MCLAVPLKIVEIDGKNGVGEVEGLRRNMRLDFIKEPKLGEYVIVHAGFAIERPAGEAGARGHRGPGRRSKMRSEEILERINALPPRGAKLMEVCGTHTMSIARAGIKRLLPEGVELLSGPGLPGLRDPGRGHGRGAGALGRGAACALHLRRYAARPRYAARRRPRAPPGAGADVRIVYSPMDALDMAEAEPGREFVFLGGALRRRRRARRWRCSSAAAQYRQLQRFFHAQARAAGAQGAHSGRGLLGGRLYLPRARGGHNRRGEEFGFLPREYGLPAAVAGFEPEDILLAIYDLLDMLAKGAPALVNDYPRAVSAGGNELAKAAIAPRVFEPRRDIWRGLGDIEASGLALREEFAAFDAERALRRGDKARRREEPLPLRRGHNRAHTPAGLPDVRRACTPGRPPGTLACLQRGRLRCGV